MIHLKAILRFVILAIVVFSVGVQRARADAAIMYIQSGGLTTGACNSWATACELQYGLTSAASNSELWVKAGTYRPTTVSTDRTATFQLKNGVAIYGGFAGTETLRTQRDPLVNVTILSGDIGQNDTANPVTNVSQIQPGNSYRVVTGSGTNTSAVLDGFTVTAGTDGSAPYQSGPGMYNSAGSPTLANLHFSGNYGYSGGGMYNVNSHPTLTNVTFSNNNTFDGAGMFNLNSNPTLINVTFSHNGDMSNGGGMYNNNSSPGLTNVLFDTNSGYLGGGIYNTNNSNPILTDVTFYANKTSNNGRGGGMYNTASSPILTNVTFDVNFSTNSGGGIHNEFSNPILTNVTFNGNSSALGGGLYNWNSIPTLNHVTFSGNIATLTSIGSAAIANFGNVANTPVIKNTIIWGNSPTNNQVYDNGSTPSVTYSVVQGGYAGTGNLNTDPLLGALSSNGGFTKTMAIGVGSSALDTAQSATCASTDQRGIVRPQGSACDMGAFEMEQRIISGNAGIAGATLSYENGGPQMVVASGDGSYSITVLPGWSGTITPSLDAYAFTPSSRNYTNILVDQIGQDYVATPATIVHIESGGLTSGICDTWANACELQYGLTGAAANSELWVKAGTYHPTTTNDRSATFHLKNGVALYGGFIGTETLRTERDPIINITILSGDIGIAADASDNSYHVVVGGGTNLTSVLDGFTITMGNAAEGSSHVYFGGGMYNNAGSPTLKNLIFSNNTTTSCGGGMANENGSHPTLTNVVFNSNSLAFCGGGIYNDASSPTLTNVIFSDNSVTGFGGGMYNYRHLA